MEPLKKAYDEGLISPLYMNCDETEKMLHSSLLKNVASEEETRNNLADLANDVGLRPIADVVVEMEEWACFRPQEQRLYPKGETRPPSTLKRQAAKSNAHAATARNIRNAV